MIATVQGQLQKIGDKFVIINVGGVGLHIYVPQNVLSDPGPVGRQLMLHTHLIVRETELTLYGFPGEEDRALFELLLGVNGVGPKVALAILSTLSPEMLRGAVAREEPAVLQRVPGIGKKTAQRLIFALQDKLDASIGDSSTPLITDVDADVIDVLTALGFSIVEAQGALQQVPRDVDGVDARVQEALRYLGTL
ncbi:MAG TPA: Holliday junction branch migration protein RuvA [Anaerolineae bacterium]|nr:Holliday junction branch migration protein RuvA [Anaerolineae bacterium]